MLDTKALKRELQQCRSVVALRALQRSRFEGEIGAEWIEPLDDACMFGAAGVLGMIQHGVSVDALQFEIVQMMTEALRSDGVVH